MEQLKGSQRKYLRSQAHHLKPLVLIGRNGINSQVMGSVDLALKDHELIKVKFGEFKDAKKKYPRRLLKPQKANLSVLSGTSLFFTGRIPRRRKGGLRCRKARMFHVSIHSLP